MTCIPASRRARATTLMPRSWPSSPTLARTMRKAMTRASSVFSVQCSVFSVQYRSRAAYRTSLQGVRRCRSPSSLNSEHWTLSPLRADRDLGRFAGGETERQLGLELGPRLDLRGGGGELHLDRGHLHTVGIDHEGLVGGDGGVLLGLARPDDTTGGLVVA